MLAKLKGLFGGLSSKLTAVLEPLFKKLNGLSLPLPKVLKSPLAKLKPSSRVVVLAAFVPALAAMSVMFLSLASIYHYHKSSLPLGAVAHTPSLGFGQQVQPQAGHDLIEQTRSTLEELKEGLANRDIAVSRGAYYVSVNNVIATLPQPIGRADTVFADFVLELRSSAAEAEARRKLNEVKSLITAVITEHGNELAEDRSAAYPELKKKLLQRLSPIIADSQLSDVLIGNFHLE